MSKAVIATMMHKLQGTHRYTDIAMRSMYRLPLSFARQLRQLTSESHLIYQQLLPLMSLEEMLADINSISSSQIQKVDEY